MSFEIRLTARQSGKLDSWYRQIITALLKGSVDIAGCDETNAKAHKFTLKKTYNINVVYEPLYSKTNMKVIFDPNDFSAEPGIIGIDYGKTFLWGYRFTLKGKSDES